MLNRSFALLSLAALTLVPSFAKADEKPRLIETRPGVRFWSTAAERKELLRRSHAEGKCGGFMDLTNFEVSHAAPKPTRMDLAGKEPTQQARVTPLLGKADAGNLLAFVTKMSAFPDRKYDTEQGVKAAGWVKAQYEAIARNRPGTKVSFFEHKGIKQPSVVAEITGTGPQKNEIVVIGGHIDSTSNGLAPGADDDASGTATVIETFRILVESGYQPNRTILFMGYAGEEGGLLGSSEIAPWFRNNGKVVVGALQFDMTMYPGTAPSITFITDYTNRDLTRYVERLSDEYVKAKWIEDQCGYACSDHASWTKAGYASAFPFESAFNQYNPDIHSPRDTVKNLDPNHGVKYLKLSLAFAVEAAESKAQVFRLR